MIIKKQFVNKDIIRVLTLTLITIFAWIAFDVYRTLNKDVQSEVLKEQMEPLNPEINIQVVEELKQRESPDEKDFTQIPEERLLQFTGPDQEKISSQSADKT